MLNPESNHSSLENQEKMNSLVNEEVESQGNLDSNELNGEESTGENTSENQEEIINTVKEKAEEITIGVNEALKEVVKGNDQEKEVDLEVTKQELINFKKSLETYREEFNSESTNKETRKIKKKLNKLIEVAIKRAEIQVKKIEKKQEKENGSNQEKLLSRDDEKRMELQDKFKVLKQLLKFKGTWWDFYKLKYPSYAKKDAIKSEMFLELNDSENYSNLEKKMIEKYGTVKNYVKSELKNLRQEYLNLNQVENDESLAKEDEIAPEEPSSKINEDNAKQESEGNNSLSVEDYLKENNGSSFEEIEEELRTKMEKELTENSEFERFGEHTINAIVSNDDEKRKKIIEMLNDLKNKHKEELNSSESEFNWESFQIDNKNNLKNFLNKVSNSEVELNNELKEKISESVKKFYLEFIKEKKNFDRKNFFSQIFDKNNEGKTVGKFVLDLISSFDDEKANIGEENNDEDSANSNQKEKNENSNSERSDEDNVNDNQEEGKNKKNSNHELLISEKFEKFKNFFESKINEKENFNKIMEVMFINLTEKMESFDGFSQGNMFEKLKDKISEWGKQLDYSLDEEEIDYLKNFPNNLEKSQIQPMLDFLIDQIQKKKDNKSIEDKGSGYDAMILIFKNFKSFLEKKEN